MLSILWQLFLVFTRVAVFSWGGGPASLALMQREVVEQGWLNAAEFADGVAVSNALPGPTAPKAAAFVGYQVAGLSGAILATIGTVIPTTVLMLIVIIFFFQVKDSISVKAMLKAVRPVIVGLLLWTAYDMARSVLGAGKIGWGQALAHGADKLAIAAVTFLVLTLTDVSPVFIVIGAAVLGFVLYR